jgi:hypothetical protein
MHYLVPTMILAAFFSFSAYADAAPVAPEAQEEVCDETALLVDEAEGENEEMAALTDEEQLLKGKAKETTTVNQ